MNAYRDMPASLRALSAKRGSVVPGAWAAAYCWTPDPDDPPKPRTRTASAIRPMGRHAGFLRSDWRWPRPGEEGGSVFLFSIPRSATFVSPRDAGGATIAEQQRRQIFYPLPDRKPAALRRRPAGQPVFPTADTVAYDVIALPRPAYSPPPSAFGRSRSSFLSARPSARNPSGEAGAPVFGRIEGRFPRKSKKRLPHRPAPRWPKPRHSADQVKRGFAFRTTGRNRGKQAIGRV